MPNRTWKKASEHLKFLYLALNEPEEITYDDLEEYCKTSFYSGTFATKADIHNYATGYRRIANALVHSQEITELVARQKFLTGLPRHLASFVAQKVPQANCKHSSPPTIEKVIEILYDRLGREALDWNSYEHAKRQALKKVMFGEDLATDDEGEPPVTTKDTTCSTKLRIKPTEDSTYGALLKKMDGVTPEGQF